MRRSAPFAILFAALGCAFLLSASTPAYVPAADYCAGQGPTTGSPLCATLPGNIGPDPVLKIDNGYRGIVGANPTAPSNDVETPFDNYSWQTFVALNWAQSQAGQPAQKGLDGTAGPRVWQGWSRVSKVFGNSPVQANCQVPQGYEYFSIGSNGSGKPTAQNEEYIEAATLKPAIDVNGNYTLYERRVNGIEIAYLKAPGGPGQPTWNLTTVQGQQAFVNGGGKTNFPAFTGTTPNGAMEIKAAWRILDPKNHAANQKLYYVVRAVIGVPPDLVDRGTKAIVAPVCTKVDLGLVAMHIIQKNVTTKDTPALKADWFWTTFEHVDNAPLATNACDITSPGTCGMLNQTACPTAATGSFSYYDPTLAKAQTNFPANGGKAFKWNGSPPYAKAYLQSVPGSTRKAGSQITRCWQVYQITQALNAQWQGQLKAIGSVFANYMLIGTQWGAAIEPRSSPGPEDAAPNYLSNTVLETYLQTFYEPGGKYSPFTTGSCVSCHTAATLVAGTGQTANFSFLPGLASAGLVRMLPPSKAFMQKK
ncbi:MAG: hypothetical protein JSR60_16240 [Proteobacteria bacterium]|nr:hypothetical protein [Pseudomonadota bacterium]